jgi:hypothetical protein
VFNEKAPESPARTTKRMVRRGVLNAQLARSRGMRKSCVTGRIGFGKTDIIACARACAAAMRRGRTQCPTLRGDSLASAETLPSYESSKQWLLQCLV